MKFDNNIKNSVKTFGKPFLLLLPMIFMVCILSACLKYTVNETMAYHMSDTSYSSDNGMLTLRVSANKETINTAETINRESLKNSTTYNYRKHYDAFNLYDPRFLEKPEPNITLLESSFVSPAISLGYFSIDERTNGHLFSNSNVFSLYSYEDMKKANNGQILTNNFAVLSDKFVDSLVDDKKIKNRDEILGKMLTITYGSLSGTIEKTEIIVSIYSTSIGDGPYIFSTYGKNCILNYDLYGEKEITNRSFDLQVGNSVYFNEKFLNYLSTALNRKTFAYTFYSVNENGLEENENLNNLYKEEEVWSTSNLRIAFLWTLIGASVSYLIFLIFTAKNGNLYKFKSKKFLCFSITASAALFVGLSISTIIGKAVASPPFFANLGHQTGTIIMIVSLFITFFASELQPTKNEENHQNV
jgi:hypothetical protein